MMRRPKVCGRSDSGAAPLPCQLQPACNTKRLQVRAARAVWVWQARWLMACTGWQVGSTKAHRLGLADGSSGGGGSGGSGGGASHCGCLPAPQDAVFAGPWAQVGGFAQPKALGQAPTWREVRLLGHWRRQSRATGCVPTPSGARGGGASYILPAPPEGAWPGAL